MADLKAAVGQAARFGLAGVVSTAVGFAVIAVLDAGLHVAPALANAAGYLVGVPVGFMLNRGYVFRHGGAPGAAGLRYLAAVAIAFGLNQVVLRLAGQVLGPALGPGAPAHLAAQLAGMATYTLTTFLLARYWVFRTA